MMRLIPVRVLIIDDDDSVCRKVSGWLTEADYDVTTFTDHTAALEHAQHVFSQVALVDLQFPDADVAELLDALRRISPLTRVVAMAAFPDVPLVVAAIRAGAQDVLEKPIQPPSLLAALERQLEQAGVSVRSEAEYNRRLGARVRATRAAANRTLADVAGASGLSTAQLSHIELGKTATTTWTLARICAALNTRPATLLGGP